MKKHKKKTGKVSIRTLVEQFVTVELYEDPEKSYIVISQPNGQDLHSIPHDKK